MITGLDGDCNAFSETMAAGLELWEKSGGLGPAIKQALSALNRAHLTTRADDGSIRHIPMPEELTIPAINQDGHSLIFSHDRYVAIVEGVLYQDCSLNENDRLQRLDMAQDMGVVRGTERLDVRDPGMDIQNAEWARRRSTIAGQAGGSTTYAPSIESSASMLTNKHDVELRMSADMKLYCRGMMPTKGIPSHVGTASSIRNPSKSLSREPSKRGKSRTRNDELKGLQTQVNYPGDIPKDTSVTKTTTVATPDMGNVERLIQCSSRERDQPFDYEALSNARIASSQPAMVITPPWRKDGGATPEATTGPITVNKATGVTKEAAITVDNIDDDYNYVKSFFDVDSASTESTKSDKGDAEYVVPSPRKILRESNEDPNRTPQNERLASRPPMRTRSNPQKAAAEPKVEPTEAQTPTERWAPRCRRTFLLIFGLTHMWISNGSPTYTWMLLWK